MTHVKHVVADGGLETSSCKIIPLPTAFLGQDQSVFHTAHVIPLEYWHCTGD